jgi:hypothetical protein
MSVFDCIDERVINGEMAPEEAEMIKPIISRLARENAGRMAPDQAEAAALIDAAKILGYQAERKRRLANLSILATDRNATLAQAHPQGTIAGILSLLYRLSPSDCRLIMIDPKMLELSVYDGIPHLLSPVVTDPKKAVVALKWVVGEMEERYRKMSKMGVRNIDGYNGRVKDALARGEMFKRTYQTGFDDVTGDPVFETEEFQPVPMPFIVVIVDEMADLMMVAGKDIEGAIQRATLPAPPETTGATANVAGKVHARRLVCMNTAPLTVVASTSGKVWVQICVPSASRTNSPLALLPRWMTAPVGTPADWLTVPSSRRCV